VPPFCALVALRSFEMVATVYGATQCNVPEHLTPYSHPIYTLTLRLQEGDSFKTS
jgi:hypothetical protein